MKEPCITIITSFQYIFVMKHARPPKCLQCRKARSEDLFLLVINLPSTKNLSKSAAREMHEKKKYASWQLSLYFSERWRTFRQNTTSKLTKMSEEDVLITICKQPFGANFFTLCFTLETFTFGWRQNVYVWRTKSVRFAGKTCTFSFQNY